MKISDFPKYLYAIKQITFSGFLHSICLKNYFPSLINPSQIITASLLLRTDDLGCRVAKGIDIQ